MKPQLAVVITMMIDEQIKYSIIHQLHATLDKQLTISAVFWTTIGLCIRQHIVDSVLVSVSEKVKNENTFISHQN